jgi:enamidase
MRVAITNIGTIVSGDWRSPFVQGDTIITLDEKIESVGTASPRDVQGCDVVIDAAGATAIPGLIDSRTSLRSLVRKARRAASARNEKCAR